MQGWGSQADKEPPEPASSPGQLPLPQGHHQVPLPKGQWSLPALDTTAGTAFSSWFPFRGTGGLNRNERASLLPGQGSDRQGLSSRSKGKKAGQGASPGSPG